MRVVVFVTFCYKWHLPIETNMRQRYDITGGYLTEIPVSHGALRDMFRSRVTRAFFVYAFEPCRVINIHIIFSGWCIVVII